MIVSLVSFSQHFGQLRTFIDVKTFHTNVRTGCTCTTINNHNNDHHEQCMIWTCARHSEYVLLYSIIVDIYVDLCVSYQSHNNNNTRNTIYPSVVVVVLLQNKIKLQLN